MRIRYFALSLCTALVIGGVLYFFFYWPNVSPKSEPASAVATSTSEDISNKTRTHARGTLTGKVTISPVCPVERIPPDPACAPKPYSALVDVSGLNNFFVEMHAGTDGKFLTMPPPGEYTITIRSATLYPSCPTKKAKVEADKTTTIDISCDSGIR